MRHGGNGIGDPFTHVSVFNQTTSATSTLQAFTGTPYSIAASSTSAFDQIVVGTTTSGNLATSTFFGNVDVKGYIEDDTITNSLVFDGSGGTLGAYGGSNCSAGQAPTGINGAGTAQNCTSYSNFSFPFTPLTNFGINTNSTTTAITDTIGLFASSTTGKPSWLDQVNIGSTTTGSLATSTDYGNWIVSGDASTTNLVISDAPSALLLTGAAGSVGKYGGAAGCTNQVVTAISALGATTCTTVAGAMFGTGVGANTVFGNFTGATAAPGFATSSFTIGTGLTQNSNTLGLTIPVIVSSGGTNATSFTANTIPYLNSAGTTFVGGVATTTNGGIANDILSLTTTGALNIKDIATAYTGVVSPVQHLTMTWATTTSWTGTTSQAYASCDTVFAPFSGTVQDIRCVASSTKSFLGIQPLINGGATTPSYLVASSTVGTTTLTGGNTFTSGQLIAMYVGTTTSDTSALAGECTFDITESV